MPKKILYESAVHQFLWAAAACGKISPKPTRLRRTRLADWVRALTIENPGPGSLRVAWVAPQAGEHRVELKNAKFYTRGDAAPHYKRQQEAGLTFHDDKIMAQNLAFFDGELRTVLTRSRFYSTRSSTACLPARGTRPANMRKRSSTTSGPPAWT
ncbi:MAG: hypothetical protein WDM96_18700 [Lacunisphaera sp.]